MTNRALNILRIAMLSLMLLSICLLLWQHFGMTRVLRIDGQQDSKLFSPIDDRSLGGKSIAQLEQANQATIVKCALDATAYQWPFCEASLRLAAPPAGVDLSEFDTMALDVRLVSPGNKKLRIYLRNYEPEFSNLTDPLSLKVNELEVVVPDDGKIVIPLRFFRVATWWVDEKNIPFLLTDMKLNNVPQVEIATPGQVVSGNYQIEIRSIEFRGKWISLINLLLGIVIAWMLFGFIWLLLELLAYRERFHLKRAQMSELEQINRVLEIQAQVLSNKAQIDPLTGVLNREGLRDFLLLQWHDDLPSEAGLSVVFVDLDFFKRINDQYGHAVGDEVLKQFALLVGREIRHADALVRWGGEEFLVVSPGLPQLAASALAEKIRAIVEAASWPEGMRVTCSCGVATRVPGEQFSALIERADQALYRAKGGGRNRVELG
ncbi:GGDEF domain-containing protein [Chitinibacter bivalviorum]|uniref:diguanylate cyclase n=1 Tax=Chitinibacter bivalviorum TaxID=2739434 RepID=A0A7H9BIM7_9NEIS|nr:GGDEF domain-containing protein [Chitinibacter bivalviorum]QLG88319.1 GGDEF domain-containing protein [Chitinibacter bivalviorum]